MKNSRRDGLHRAFRLLTAIAVIATALAAIGESLRINASGASPRYSVESAGPALARVGLMALAAALLAAAAALSGRGIRRRQPVKAPDAQSLFYMMKQRSERRVWLTRALIAAAALGLIAFGVFNGSMKDVLKKAIAICTECIGLG